jgi:hypothetical protein
MRAISGREPLQPLPSVQRPMTPPQTHRSPAKYGGMAQTSPKKDTSLQIASREELDIYDSEGDAQYYDFEEEGTSTVKPQKAQSGWQIGRPASPQKQMHARSSSQVTSQPQYAPSNGKVVPRSSATSSTAVSPTTPATPTFGVNLPRPPRKFDALEDILLPALDAVRPLRTFIDGSAPALQQIPRRSVSCVSR